LNVPNEPPSTVAVTFGGPSPFLVVIEMTPPMAVRAEKIALGGLRPDPRRHRTDATQGEVLRSGVTVMELQRRRRAVVAAVFALPTSGGE